MIILKSVLGYPVPFDSVARSVINSPALIHNLARGRGIVPRVVFDYENRR